MCQKPHSCPIYFLHVMAKIDTINNMIPVIVNPLVASNSRKPVILDPTTTPIEKKA